jgi:uncharacterized protein (UPF0332 family)
MCETGLPVSFVWKHYLTLAEELAQNKNDEAKLRASLSRAYYAAFCNARNYMRDKDHRTIPDGESEHAYLVRYFKGDVHNSKSNDTRKNIGKDLDNMRINRKKVDYNDSVGNLRVLDAMTRDALARSKRVIENIERGGF